MNKVKWFSSGSSQEASPLFWRTDVASCVKCLVWEQSPSYGSWLISLHLPLSGPRHQLTESTMSIAKMWSALYQWNSLNLMNYNQREHAYIIYHIVAYPSRLRRSTWGRWSNFHASKSQTRDSPDWFRIGPIIQTCFCDLLFLSSSIFCRCDHETMSVLTIPMSRWSFDWCFQALLVSTQVRWPASMDPLGHPKRDEFRMKRMDSEMKLHECVSVRMGILPELSQTFEFRNNRCLIWCFGFQMNLEKGFASQYLEWNLS